MLAIFHVNVKLLKGSGWTNGKQSTYLTKGPTGLYIKTHLTSTITIRFYILSVEMLIQENKSAHQDVVHAASAAEGNFTKKIKSTYL